MYVRIITPRKLGGHEKISNMTTVVSPSFSALLDINVGNNTKALYRVHFILSSFQYPEYKDNFSFAEFRQFKTDTSAKKITISVINMIKQIHSNLRGSMISEVK